MLPNPLAMPDHVADSTCATGLVEVGALGGVDLCAVDDGEAEQAQLSLSPAHLTVTRQFFGLN